MDRAKLVRVEGEWVILRGIFNENRPSIEGIDAVVSLLVLISNMSLLSDLKAAGVDLSCIGDAKLP